MTNFTIGSNLVLTESQLDVNNNVYYNMPLKKDIKNFIDQTAFRFYEDGRLSLGNLSEYFNIGIYEVEFEDDKISGAILKSDDEWKIYVNKTDPHNRKRFTLAHELGHYISYINGSCSKDYLDKENKIEDRAVFQRNTNKKGSKDYLEMEREANQIAAELLMPINGVKSLVEEGKMNLEEMADFFGVSVSAMGFRLVNLEYLTLESLMINNG